MNLLFVTPSYKPAYVYGGPTVSVSELAEALVAAGHRVTVYTTTANGKEELAVAPGKAVAVNGVSVYYFRRQTGDHTHVSVGLWKKLWQTCQQYDLIHLQSWWSLLIFGAAAICRMKNKPYVVSPRGMLSGYSFAHQHSGVKRLLHRVAGRRLLAGGYLHATTPAEWKDGRQLNPAWKGFVLPNIFIFPPKPLVKTPAVAGGAPLVLGFLSRIDPKKGLPLLLEALAQVSFDFRLQVAGTGEAAYLDSLKAKAAALGLQDKIVWCGWKSGEEKFAFYQSIDVYVLTSYNENFANTVTEALATGTPVLVSRGVGLSDYVQEKRLGWVCDTAVPAIVQALEQLSREREAIARINREAPAQIEKDYHPLTLARQYAAAYAAIVFPPKQQQPRHHPAPATFQPLN